MASEVPIGYKSPKVIVGDRPQLVTPSTSGGRIDSQGNLIHNRLLLEIHNEEFETIAPYLEYIEMSTHQELHTSTSGFEYGYFPNEGLISLVISVKDGRSVEVGIVGREGFVGTPIAVGCYRSPYGAIVQAPGATYRIKAEVLEVTLAETPDLRRRLTRFALLQGMQVAQLAACNRLHEIDQRLARWMLMCGDRLESDLLPMTHEFFAEMLGTGRPTVSVAAAVLQRAGFIQYARGTVKIADRAGLESAACECYKVIQEFDR